MSVVLARNLPSHVGIIMDGNGRWAEARGLPRPRGHREGSQAVRRIVRAARRLGLRALTLYAFSEQNWARPEDEVDALMELLREFLLTERGEILGNGIRLNAVGNVGRLPHIVRAVLDPLRKESESNDAMTLTLALSYGGREEIVDAARELARRVERGELRPDDVTEAALHGLMPSLTVGDPDLVIRTGGERRISNFLLYGLAYAELYFADVLWPDFQAEHLYDAIASYQSRERRFGLLGVAANDAASGKMSNLAVRLLTAAVVVPLLLLLLYRGPAWGLYLLILPASLIGTWELLAMTHRGDVAAQVTGLVLAAASSAAVYFGKDARLLLTVLAVVPVAGPLVTLARLGDIKTAGMRALTMSMAPLFVSMPLGWLAVVRRDVPDGASYVVMTLMFAWFSDTGGYFAGRFLGKHKLYEAVSPKKTVEGAFGGLGGSIVGALLAHFWFLPRIPLTHALALGVVAGALGQAGDLGESLVKRSMGVKDSGAIVPGHGGILDRIDALLLTSTVVYLYTLWMKPP